MADGNDKAGKATEVALTTYEVSIEVTAEDGASTWRPLAVAEGRGAKPALNAFCERMGDELQGGNYRLVPASNISRFPVGVKMERVLSIGDKA